MEPKEEIKQVWESPTVACPPVSVFRTIPMVVAPAFGLPYPEGPGERGFLLDLQGMPLTVGRFYSAFGTSVAAALFRLVRWIPRRLALALGSSLGDAVYYLARRGRRHAARLRIERLYRRSAVEDLALALGPGHPRSELVRIVRDCFRTAGRSLAEILRIPAMTEHDIVSIVDADSFEPVERVLKRGKGLLVLLAHIGAWELLGPYLTARLGRPTCAIAQRLRHPKYDEVINHVRRSYGSEVIYQEMGARPVLAALRRNRPVFVLGDIDMPQLDGIFVDFFGRPAYTPIGPAALARASGAAIVPIFITWNGLRHRAHVLPEIEPVRTRDRDADIAGITRRWTKAVEDIVGRYPEQWVWFHRRWRTRPEDVRQDAPHPGDGA